MSDREKLIGLVDGAMNLCINTKCSECIYIDEVTDKNPLYTRNCQNKLFADHLISNGVTVQKPNCPYCCDDGEGAHGRLKYSYDDEDGMTMSIHPSPKRKDGTRSMAWWATVHFRGDCRDFIIEVCPFCGRRLVTLREEYDSVPEPPKECE